MTHIIFLVLFMLVCGTITLAGIVFWVVEIIDVAQRNFERQDTKILWLLVVVIGHAIGALVYYFVGRQQGTLAPGMPAYVTGTQYAPPPIITTRCKILSKRTSFDVGWTNYYVAVEFENGRREEYSVTGPQSGLLAEGDTGLLHAAGNRLINFERDAASAETDEQ